MSYRLEQVVGKLWRVWEDDEVVAQLTDGDEGHFVSAKYDHRNVKQSKVLDAVTWANNQRRPA